MKEITWETIVEKVLHDLETNAYAPGEKLPSENKLAHRFGASRAEVRKAYRELKHRGYIFSVQGRGSFFVGKREKLPFSMTRGRSFSETAELLHCTYQTETVSCKTIGFNPQIYRSLEAEEGDVIWKVVQRRILDGEPAVLHIHYLPEKQFPDLAETGAKLTSFYGYLREHGYRQIRVASPQLTVGLLTKKEEELLSMPSYATGLIYSAQTLHAPAGAILELGRTIYRSDRFTFLLEAHENVIEL